MEHSDSLALLDEILAPWKSLLAEDYLGYRNHCTRMLLCCLYLVPQVREDEKRKLTIAAAFHDIGIWIENTVDYIEPSLPPAKAYLEDIGRQEWYEEVALMITEHHKLRAFTDSSYPLVEVFRQGDLVDFSKGLVRFGLPSAQIKEFKRAFPNAGFHRMLMRRGFFWFLKHPLNPAPMMKW